MNSNVPVMVLRKPPPNSKAYGIVGGNVIRNPKITARIDSVARLPKRFAEGVLGEGDGQSEFDLGFFHRKINLSVDAG
jgi:hypothetical protein